MGKLGRVFSRQQVTNDGRKRPEQELNDIL